MMEIEYEFLPIELQQVLVSTAQSFIEENNVEEEVTIHRYNCVVTISDSKKLAGELFSVLGTAVDQRASEMNSLSNKEEKEIRSQLNLTKCST